MSTFVRRSGGPIHSSLLSLFDATLDRRPVPEDTHDDPQIASVSRTVSAVGSLGSRVLLERALADVYKRLGINSQDLVIVNIYKVDDRHRETYDSSDVGFVSRDQATRGELITVREFLKAEGLL